MSIFGFLKPVEHAAGGGFHFLKDVATGTVNTVKNTADIVNAGRQGVQGLIQGSAAAITHNPIAEKNAVIKTNKAIDYSLNASRGALTPEEVQNGDLFGSSKERADLIKPIVRNAAAIAPLVVPAGKIAEGASAPLRFLAQGTVNAGVAAGTTAADQAVETGHVNPADVAKSAAIGGALGLAGEGVHTGVKAIKEGVPGVAAHYDPSVSPEDLHALSKADNVDQVKRILGTKVSPEVVDKVAPAIIHTKDPSAIDNIINRAANPVPLQDIKPAVDTSVPPPILPKEAPVSEVKPTESPVKPEATVGERTLKDLANMSNSVEEFNQKLSELPENADVRAAIEKSGAQSVDELYHNINPDPFREILGAVTGTPASKGQSPVKGIEGLRAEQNAILSRERGQRFGSSAAAGAEQSGSAGYFAEKAALSGEYSKVPHEGLISDLGPERAESLFAAARDKILATPDETYKALGLHPGGARLNTQRAVRKVIGLEPGLPTTSEIKLLKVFNPALADLAEQNRPKYHQLMDFAAKVFGTVRAAKSTADFSMGGRQGLFVAARHPVQWALANKESVKYATNGDYYKQQMNNIESDPWVKLGDQQGLQLPGANLKNEEAYAGSDLLTGHVAKDVLKVGNVVAGAERAYDGGLTYLRASIWKSTLEKFGDSPEAAAAALGEKGLKGLSEAINTLTGRGGKDNGFVTKHINTLAETLFSPRLWASRLEPFNPKFWARIGPAGRAEAFQSLGSFAAVASVVLGAAAASGAEVETDPRSSDFLKIKVGDTRYDILGGFQQNLVFGWRELTGEKKNSTTGAVTKFAPGVTDPFRANPMPVKTGFGTPDRVSIASDLAGNKLNPVLSSAKKVISGKDAGGQPVNYATEIGQLFVPISIQGTSQTIHSTGSIPEGILKNAPDFFGVGSQTYGVKELPVTKNQQKYIDDLKKNNASQDQIDATKLFYQTIKTVPAKNYVYGQIDSALKAGDVNKATKLAKEYNDTFSQAFDSWRKKYGDRYNSDPTLVDSYVSRQITDDELQNRIDKITPGG